MTVVQSQGDVMARVICEDVQSVDVADAAREVRLAGAQLSQHDLDALIDRVEGDAEKRIVLFLCLRSELRVVHLESRASSDIRLSKVVEDRAPTLAVEPESDA
jgi:hypothetical protein